MVSRRQIVTREKTDRKPNRACHMNDDDQSPALTDCNYTRIPYS